ncbi:MAG: hypothetical protein AB1305_01380 [Candidatus Hadarchaeota archaeon]
MKTKILVPAAVLLAVLIGGYAWLNLRPPGATIPPPGENLQPPPIVTPPPAVPAPSLFGIELSTSVELNQRINEADLLRATELKAKWVRLWVGWNKIEETQGILDFSYLDQQVTALSDNGFGIVAVLMGAPPHASRIVNPPTDFEYFIGPPKLSEYENFLRAIVLRYKSRVKYWEIWNEPNDAGFWRPAPNAGDYAELLKVAYAVIKETDENAKVLIGAVGPIPDDGDEAAGTENYHPYMEFMENVLKALGDSKPFDIITLHPYRIPKGPLETRSIKLENGQSKSVTFKEELLEFKRLFDKYDQGNKKLWITEIGWLANDYSSDRTDLISENKQAEFLGQVYSAAKNDGDLSFVESIFWFNLTDFAGPGTDRFFGMVYENHSPKPAFGVYKSLASGG